MDLNALRLQYEAEGIDPSTLAADPIEQFNGWLDDSIAAELVEPNAMTLSTVDDDGPDARVVLLKGIDQRGFAFFTNFDSAKGDQMGADPRGALTFLWQPLHRQVRVRGTIQKVADQESDDYYAGRPRGSQIGAWASPQSRPVADRSTLERAVAEVERRFGGGPIERPPNWGGYRVAPTVVEFWQGQPSRLHDRVRYTRNGDGTWSTQRLAP